MSEKNSAYRDKYARSDLACETRPPTDNASGVITAHRESHGFELAELTITDEASAEAVGRPIGRYVTAYIGKIWLEGDKRMRDAAELVSSELTAFVESALDGKRLRDSCIMFAGLGNRFITADALGPLTADKLTVTRHMMDGGGFFDRLGCSRLCAVMPGVLGQTGIEAAHIIRGAAEAARPDAVIAVDALAARSTERLFTTVQLSDSGICPGSGIGNRRLAINSESVGCPVIALGVPTVVDSSTRVWDALEQAGIEEVSDSLRTVLDSGQSFFVSLKECDVIIDEVSALLADAVGTCAGVV